ncbi:amino acid ABC transporter ATP-binding protein [Bacillus wiedmannii]|uniref:amino acid ABC transporter ATP-binding protein n=1 Tax=Bacillus wiedmannii TaxID=1890302 RepID=UPI000BF244E0|nr:amino acid ABC transporter ATP-binding protein [Bacillus wiedmannii]PEJ98939.1 amino acid ABC transporter ATP-binding protein [Bacillus wiedmannii]PEL83026.1 amino acid ABC transporter ATP-binding protein [Bacillus wiedmannii]PEM26807.1 amino acid ABC transporter ATP-binding protein [Bacillus wiedmannii]PEM85723.1 amino acid ABC transporter ATP-binding protein [Bacillus wiedmannii]PEO85272.1 amino acid ABC transporter ATP-binding protein [Bacillus wiedmannii]
MIEMKEQREIPLLFFGAKMKGEVIFLPIFEYKKNVHALLGEGGGEYVDRVS